MSKCTTHWDVLRNKCNLSLFLYLVSLLSLSVHYNFISQWINKSTKPCYNYTVLFYVQFKPSKQTEKKYSLTDIKVTHKHAGMNYQPQMHLFLTSLFLFRRDYKCQLVVGILTTKKTKVHKQSRRTVPLPQLKKAIQRIHS